MGGGSLSPESPGVSQEAALAPGKALLTGAVDVHVDGLLVALRLQEQQLRDNQAGDTVVDLQVSGEGGLAQLGGKEGLMEATGRWLGMKSGNKDGCHSPSKTAAENSGPGRGGGEGW